MIRNIRTDRLVFGRNPPAGMDLSVIGHWAMVFRKTAELCDPPIVVDLIEGVDPPLYRVTDGRHRVIGAIVAGRDVIAARIELF